MINTQRLIRSASFLSAALLGAAAQTGCATQECVFLNDCPNPQVCSAEGQCVDSERRFLGGGMGGGAALGVDVDVDGDGDIDVSIGEVTTPGPEATLVGDIGPIGGFEGRAQVGAYADGDFGFTTVDVRAESDEGYGLFLLTLPDGLPSLPIGTTTYDEEAAMEGGTYVQLCSDSVDGDIHFDGYPELTVITVTENEDDNFDVDIDTTITEGFDGLGAGPTTVRASFVLLR
jgi:hypothetical protein